MSLDTTCPPGRPSLSTSGRWPPSHTEEARIDLITPACDLHHTGCDYHQSDDVSLVHTWTTSRYKPAMVKRLSPAPAPTQRTTHLTPFLNFLPLDMCHPPGRIEAASCCHRALRGVYTCHIPFSSHRVPWTVQTGLCPSHKPPGKFFLLCSASHPI